MPASKRSKATNSKKGASKKQKTTKSDEVEETTSIVTPQAANTPAKSPRSNSKVGVKLFVEEESAEDNEVKEEEEEEEMEFDDADTKEDRTKDQANEQVATTTSSDDTAAAEDAKPSATSTSGKNIAASKKSDIENAKLFSTSTSGASTATIKGEKGDVKPAATSTSRNAELSIFNETDHSKVAAVLNQTMPTEIPSPDGEEAEDFFEDDEAPADGAKASRRQANEDQTIGTISLWNDMQKLPRFEITTNRHDRNGRIMYPNRLVSVTTKGNETLLLSFQPRNNTTMPACHYWQVRIKSDQTQYNQCRRRFFFYGIMELRSPDNATVPLNGGREGALSGMSWKCILRVRVTRMNPYMLRSWANRIAEMISHVASQGPYDALYQYAGDITPREPQPLGYYLTVQEVFKVLERRYRGTPLSDLLDKKEIISNYFNERELQQAKEYFQSGAHRPLETNDDNSRFLSSLNFNATYNG